MSRKRRVSGGAFKAKVALAAVRGDKSTAQLASEYEVHPKVAETMAKRLAGHDVDVLVVIGGDGMLQATKEFQKWTTRHGKLPRPFDIIGFLKTIDNGVKTETSFEGIETCLCPGYPSAVRKIVDATEALRVSATTAQRAFIVETMGRDAGWLAAATAFGGAAILLIPEIRQHIREKILKKNIHDASGITGISGGNHDSEIDKEIMERLRKRVRHFYRKNRNVLIGCSEGTWDVERD